MIKQILLVALTISTAFCYLPDAVYEMPDCDPFTYNSFSGYLPVTQTKSLHYMFVQS